MNDNVSIRLLAQAIKESMKEDFHKEALKRGYIKESMEKDFHQEALRRGYTKKENNYTPKIGDIVHINRNGKVYLILNKVYLTDSGGYGYDGMELTNPHEIPTIPYPWKPKDSSEENVWTDWNGGDRITFLQHVDLYIFAA